MKYPHCSNIQCDQHTKGRHIKRKYQEEAITKATTNQQAQVHNKTQPEKDKKEAKEMIDRTLR